MLDLQIPIRQEGQQGAGTDNAIATRLFIVVGGSLAFLAICKLGFLKYAHI